MRKRKQVKRLSYEDRKKIEILVGKGESLYDIAVSVGAHETTIRRELKRGGEPYSADTAQMSL